MIEVDKLLSKEPLEVRLFPSTKATKFKTTASLIELINTNVNFWQKYSNTNVGQQCYQYFSHVSSVLTAAINTQEEPTSNRSRILNSLGNISGVPAINCNSPEVQFFSEVAGSNQQLFVLCIDKYFGMNLNQFPSEDQFRAIFLSFLYRDVDGLIGTSMSNGKQILDQTIESTTRRAEEYNSELGAKFIELESKIADFDTERVAKLDRFEREARDFVDQASQRQKDLETLYGEKLRLDGPAQYWERYEKRYKDSGAFWIGMTIGTTFLLLVVVALVLIFLPDKLYVDGPSFENTIRWSVLTVLGFGSLVFLVRTFLKLAMSSLHLMRDASERLQLTHQYLALLEKKAIDGEERRIILQSLFSRSESGLLKGDSAPSMPEGAASMIFRQMGSK